MNIARTNKYYDEILLKNGALKKRCSVHPFIKVMHMMGHYNDVIKVSVEKMVLHLWI